MQRSIFLKSIAAAVAARQLPRLEQAADSALTDADPAFAAELRHEEYVECRVLSDGRPVSDWKPGCDPTWEWSELWADGESDLLVTAMEMRFPNGGHLPVELDYGHKKERVLHWVEAGKSWTFPVPDVAVPRWTDLILKGSNVFDMPLESFFS